MVAQESVEDRGIVSVPSEVLHWKEDVAMMLLLTG